MHVYIYLLIYLITYICVYLFIYLHIYFLQFILPYILRRSITKTLINKSLTLIYDFNFKDTKQCSNLLNCYKIYSSLIVVDDKTGSVCCSPINLSDGLINNALRDPLLCTFTRNKKYKSHLALTARKLHIIVKCQYLDEYLQVSTRCCR